MLARRLLRRGGLARVAAAFAALGLSAVAIAGEPEKKPAPPPAAPPAPSAPTASPKFGPVAPPSKSSADVPRLDIPFEKYELKNGLTVILHEDHALPMVTVNIMVKVGARYEVVKRTGFAHLFEHLMFMGTRRVSIGMFDAWMEGEGGWNNAWTGPDFTDYYDVAPAHALPLLLWMEGDRLTALGSQIDDAKLKLQQDVVRNERRQRSENEPYAKVELVLPELLYPPGHPYHHPVIGSHEDIEAAKVPDVKAFFDSWYRPNNLSLVVAGDFERPATKAMIEKYFGSLPEGTIPQPPAATPAKLDKIVKKTIPDEVRLPKIVLAWHSPARLAPGDAELGVASVALTVGKESRLYKPLIVDRSLAESVNASQVSQDLGSYFEIEIYARPDADLDEIERVVAAEVARLVRDGLSDAELLRAKNQYETSFVANLQSVESRAAQLAMYEVTTGDPGFAEKDLARYQAVTQAGLKKTAAETFDPARFVAIRVLPKKPEGGSK